VLSNLSLPLAWSVVSIKLRDSLCRNLRTYVPVGKVLTSDHGLGPTVYIAHPRASDHTASCELHTEGKVQFLLFCFLRKRIQSA
jgi:hypothetical protein